VSGPDGSTTISDEPVRAGRFDVVHLTDTGTTREQNQDAAWSAAAGDRAVLVVADGMGGHKGGAAASATAVDIVRAEFERAGEVAPDMTVTFARVSKGVAEAAPDGGTTLVVALVSSERVEVWHVGDSRAYLYREGSVRRITSDHSWVQALVDKGKLTTEQAAVHPRRNVLLRAVGKGRDPDPTYSAMRFMPDDLVLLCSDGLHGVVTDAEIGAILERGDSIETIAQRLVQAAIDRGAPDNIGIALAAWRTNETEERQGNDE